MDPRPVIPPQQRECGLRESEDARKGSGRLGQANKLSRESDVSSGVISESDILNANAVSGMRRMSLRIKRDRKMYVRRHARELAGSGRFSGWLSIEFELRYVEGYQQARVWLDDIFIREELDILCRQAKRRKRTPKRAGK
jgi:hypothetical protein